MLIETENKYSKTYKTKERVVNAMKKFDSRRGFRYIIILTSKERYQPIIVDCGDYPVCTFLLDDMVVV